MTKQRIRSVVATVFSIIIVFGSWLLTNALLNKQHRSLMNTVRSVSVKETLEVEPDDDDEPTRVSLSNQEISIILNDMGTSRTHNYHDPYDGQLTMEEALITANSGLSYFCDTGVLPKELQDIEFIQTNAFLYDLQTVRPVPAPEESDTVPHQAYSFWSVRLSNRDISVEILLNALTGKIWKIDVSSSFIDINFDGLKTLDVLEQYEAYLGLTGGGELRSNETNAFKSYENNQFGVTVCKKVGEGSRHYETIHFSLTALR